MSQDKSLLDTLDQAKKSHQLGFLWSSSEKVVFQSLIKEVLKDCLVLKNTIPHERITNFLTGHRFQFKIAMYRLVTEELRTDGQHLLFPLFDHTILHNLRRHPRYDFEESERVFCHFTNPFDNRTSISERVMEMSSSGLSLLLNKQSLLFTPKTQIAKGEITMNNNIYKVTDLEVVYNQKMLDLNGNEKHQVGFKFI